MRWLKHSLVMVCGLVACAAMGSEAQAGEYDLVLARFGTFNPKQLSDCTNACGIVVPNDAYFKALAADLGQVLAPRFVHGASTLGEAGFAVHLLGSFSSIPSNEPYWREALEGKNPPESFFTGHLQVRKGLPFSLEVGGNLGFMPGSEMFTVGADVEWAVNEGFRYFPDVALRGAVNNVLGSRDLNMLTAGGDISASYSFHLGNVMSLEPYAGYQQLYILASSRLLNAYPQDPRPPQYSPDDPESRTFIPEFVFSQYGTTVGRVLLGAKLKVWIVSLGVEGILGKNVNQMSVAGGMDF